MSAHYPLSSTDEKTAGPSPYYSMSDSASRIGFLSPHSHNFCHLCNHIRVTIEGLEGRSLLCLGNEYSTNLRSVLRADFGDVTAVKQAIIAAMELKPEKHHFNLQQDPDMIRFMTMTAANQAKRSGNR